MEREFIDVLNKYIKVSNDKYGYDIPSVLRRIGATPEFDTPLNDLVYGYSFKGISILSEFYLMEEILYNPENGYYAFANYIDYNLTYVLADSTEEICLLDDETYEIDMYCAKDLRSFISALTEALRFFVLQFEETLNNGQIEECGKRCIEKAGGEKYSLFYKYFLGFGLD